MARRLRGELESDDAAAGTDAAREKEMKVHVKHTIKSDVATVFKLCTEQKHQESIYSQLGGTELKVKREGRAPNVKLRISRKEAGESAGRHPQDRSQRERGEPHRGLDRGRRRARGGHRHRHQRRAGEDRRHQVAHARERRLRVAWNFDVTCGIPLLGGVIASFVGSEIEQKLEREFKVLKAMA